MVREGFGLSRVALGRAVPIAKKRLANLGGGYNPLREVFFDSSVSPRSQPYFPGVQVRLNVRVKGL
jgi:hypothetical protein